MPVLTAAQCATYAQAAGFRGSALTTMVAICGAESSYDTAAVGDVRLEDQTYGPSIGLGQVRSLREDAGTGRTRDASRLYDPAFNLSACWEISNHGATFQPWSTYTSGAYRGYLGGAQGGGSNASGTTPIPTGPPKLTGLVKESGPRLDLATRLGKAFVGGKVDLTTDKASEITFEFEDPFFDVARTYSVNVGSVVNYSLVEPGEFQVVEVELKPGTAGARLVLHSQPLGANRLRTGIPTASSGISPTDYMRALANAAGLNFVGEPSATRSSIGPSKIRETRGGLTLERKQTAWEVGADWAGKLGFYAFEAGGVYYFGSPAYLVKRGNKLQLTYGPFDLGSGAGRKLPLLDVPGVIVSKRVYVPGESIVSGATKTQTLRLADTLDDVTVTGSVQREAAQTVLPGMSVSVAVEHPFQRTGLICTQVTWSLTDTTSPATVAAKVAESLPASARTAQDDTAAASGSSGTLRRGSKMSLDFLHYAMRQVGDRYVWGAHPPPSNRNPGEFDCSGLVGWAAGEVGVNFTGTSQTMQQAAKSISVAEAARTPGALLFFAAPSEHVAISMGDGVHTIEAMNHLYGVVKSTITAEPFTNGGLIPGISYR